MTRHNLSDHLSWLIRTKPSLPPESNISSASSNLGADIQAVFADDLDDATFNTNALAVEGLTTTNRSNQPVNSVRISQPLADIVNARQSMVRERVTPGSKASSQDHWLSSTDPSVLQKPKITAEPPRANGSVDDSATERHTSDVSPGPIVQERGKSIAQLVPGRKRKSEEFACEEPFFDNACSPASQSRRSRNVDSGAFTAIDDFLEREETVEKENIPTEPPPPYSTVPPLVSKRKQTEMQSSKPGGIGRMMIQPSSNAIQNSDDDDDLVDFANVSSVQYTLRVNTPTNKRVKIMEDPVIHDTPRIDKLQGLLMPRKQDTVSMTPVSVSIPDTPITQASSTPHADDSGAVARLQRVFALNDIEDVLSNLIARREELYLEQAEKLDQDEVEDVAALDLQVEDLDRRKDALQKLWARRVHYKQLVDERSRLKEAVLRACRAGDKAQRSLVSEENRACKARLFQHEKECLDLLSLCTQEIDSLLSSVLASDEPSFPDTQRPGPRQSPDRSFVKDTERVIQTQPATLGESAMSIPIQSTDHQSSRPFGLRSPVPARCNSVSTRGQRSERPEPTAFSRNMGTPPVYDVDEENYGLDDADDFFDGFGGENDHDDIEIITSEVSTSHRQAAPRSKPASERKKVSHPLPEDDVAESNFRFAWSQDVKDALKEVFGLRGFRQNQIEAINATLSGKDTFVLMPTGGGKSLCYQLPAVIASGCTRGVTAVVSPLLSLMEDQVTHMRELGMQAFFINGQTTAQERNFLLQALRGPEADTYVQLLYVTPEMLNKSQAIVSVFEHLTRRKRLARLVIDEAHCVSQWGHDFRPDYKALGDIRRKFAGVPIMALTATATENVKVDIIHNLGMQNCVVLTSSFNRPNLYYEVRAKGKGKEDFDAIAALIKDNHRKQTGIIYCLSRKNCEDMAEVLVKQHKIEAAHYHAGMESDQRSEVQKKWQAGRYQVIVATIAFGMGIDKQNVRFVVHYSLPKSLEGYYQETGRAGRDGLKSSCYLFYGYSDAGRLRKMIDDGEGSWEQKDRQHQMLRKMVQFCDNKSDCRRVQVLSYFNERFDAADCAESCDNCTSDSTFTTADLTSYARAAVNLVRELSRAQPDAKVTILQCMDMFRGAETKKNRDAGYDRLESFGSGNDLDRGDMERLFYRLLNEGVLQEDNVMNKAGFTTQYIRLGRQSNRYSGMTKFEMQIRTSHTPRNSKMVGKTAAKRKKKTSAGSDEEDDTLRQRASTSNQRYLPLSTNVSSPLQPRDSTKRKSRPSASATKSKATLYHDIAEDSADDDYEDDESDGFDPIREAIPTRRAMAAQKLGPRITSGNTLNHLNEIHRMVVDDFVELAEKKCKEIQAKKGLRTVPFSNTILQDMAATFADTEAKMMRINGIDAERVRLYGKSFLKLIKDARARYDEMMQNEQQEPVDEADQHNRNVIDLLSTDDEDDAVGEDEDKGMQDDDEDDDEYGGLGSDLETAHGPEAQSKFFPQSNVDLAAFNAQFRYSQSQAAQAATIGTQATRHKRPKKGHYKARTTVRAAPGSSIVPRRRSHTFKSRSDGQSGVTERKTISHKPARSSATQPTSKAGGGSSAWNVSMMPT